MRCTLPSNSKWSKVSSATPKPHLAHWLNHFWTRARSKTGEVLLITKIPPNRGASGRRRSIHWILRIALVWPLRVLQHCGAALHVDGSHWSIHWILPQQQQKRPPDCGGLSVTPRRRQRWGNGLPYCLWSFLSTCNLNLDQKFPWVWYKRPGFPDFSRAVNSHFHR